MDKILTIMKRHIEETAFRSLVATRPEEALQPYGLTAEEQTVLVQHLQKPESPLPQPQPHGWWV